MPRRLTKSGANAPVSLNSNLPIIIAGPTGVGKSAFAVELATQLGGEILGGDAYQVYRGLEILTAQPNDEARQDVPHHLIGHVDPSEAYDAARFVREAEACIFEIQERGRLPIIVGGSGFYLKALTHGIEEAPAPDAGLREELSSLPREELLLRLDRLDPEARQLIDGNNPRRMLRAIEIVSQSGKPLRDSRKGWASKETGGYRGLLLTRDREELEKRIECNIRKQFEGGVVEEVRRAGKLGGTAEMAIGLREIQAHLRGEMDETECIAAMVLATRRYAKRQLTWFRNQFNFPVLDLTVHQDTNQVWRFAMQALRME